MTAADRERLEALAARLEVRVQCPDPLCRDGRWEDGLSCDTCDGTGHVYAPAPDGAALRRLLAEVDAVTAERDALAQTVAGVGSLLRYLRAVPSAAAARQLADITWRQLGAP